MGRMGGLGEWESGCFLRQGRLGRKKVHLNLLITYYLLLNQEWGEWEEWEEWEDKELEFHSRE